jgi:hypothetical protein
MSADIYAQIKCIKREIAMRRRLYPRWVMAEKMSATEADAELRTMEAVLQTLEAIASPPLFEDR